MAATRTPQHKEALERARDRMTTGREVVSALATAAVTAVALVISGHSSDAGVLIIGTAVAVLVGLLLIPASSYTWSRLTYNGRTALSEIRALATGVGLVVHETADHGFTTAAQEVRTECELSIVRISRALGSFEFWNYLLPLNKFHEHEAILTTRPAVYKAVAACKIVVQDLNDNVDLSAQVDLGQVPVLHSAVFTLQQAVGILNSEIAAGEG
jgi:hypothetical protein